MVAPRQIDFSDVGGRVLVANRCSTPSTYFVNSGSATQVNQWLDHIVVVDCCDLELRWKNLSFPSGGNPAPSAGPTGVALKAGLKLAVGNTGGQATWQTATSTITLDPDGEAVARFPISIAAGTRIYSTVFITYASAPANILITSVVANDFGNYYEAGTALSDRTVASSWASGATTNYAVMPPVAITGIPTKTTGIARIGILGDSIGSHGVGSNAQYVSFAGLSTGYLGFIQRSLTHNYPWTNVGFPGLSLGTITGTSNLGTAMRFVSSITGASLTHLFLELGTNDLASLGSTDTQFLTAVASFVSMMAKRNIKVIICTIPPRTDSGNTTPIASHQSYLVSVNNALKATYGTRVFDFNAAVSQPGNPLLWRTDLGAPTTDGVHPAEVLTAAARDALTAQLSALLAA